MIIVDVFVPGAAKTKGSMEVRNRATGAMKESVAGSSRWRALMAQAVRDDIIRRFPTKQMNIGNGPGLAVLAHPYPGAVSVTVEAYLHPGVKMPQSWSEYRDWPIWNQAGDLDKIVRNVLDALGSTSKNSKLNGGAIVDDNLVCRFGPTTGKYVADEQHPAGVRIVVETL